MRATDRSHKIVLDIKAIKDKRQKLSAKKVLLKKDNGSNEANGSEVRW
jgi:hypothetical protein